MLAELTDVICKISGLNFSKINYYTDSQIVLAWIKQSADYKTFVANRVAEIRRLTNPSDWNYVRSGDNPADALTRGVSTDKISNMAIWWQGPNWLKNNEVNETDISQINLIDLPETKKTTATFMALDEFNIIDRYSNINKLVNVVGY